MVRRGIPAALEPFIVAYGKQPLEPIRPGFWEFMRAQEEAEAAKEVPRKPGAAAPTPEGRAPLRKGKGAVPPPPPGPATRLRRPPGGEPQPTVAPKDLDPTIWFDLKELWERAKRLRAHPDFPKSKGGVIVPISPAGKDLPTQAEETAIFFKVPPETFQKIPPEKRWDFLKIFLVTLEQAIQAKAPKALPGKFEFSIAPDGTFGLIYMEL